MRERMTLDLEVAASEVERSASLIAVDLYSQNRNQWRKIQKAMIGVESIGQNEAWAGDMLQGWINSNVGLMEKLAADTATNVEGIVSRGLQTGLRSTEIAKQLTGKLGELEKRKNHAKFVARDQIAKLNGQITQARQTELGVSRYVWRTSLDERVRPSHLVLQGRTCDWSNSSVVIQPDGDRIQRSSLSPSGFEGHPGEDYQCRCYAEPVLDDLVEGDVDIASDEQLQPAAPQPKPQPKRKPKPKPTPKVPKKPQPIKQPKREGVEDEEAKEVKTLWRATDATDTPRLGTNTWWAEKEDDARAYLDNPGYGGDTLFSMDANVKNTLDLTLDMEHLSWDDSDAIEALAEKLYSNEDDRYDFIERHRGDYIHDILEDRRISGKLTDEYDWIKIYDTFPEGATTLLQL